MIDQDKTAVSHMCSDAIKPNVYFVGAGGIGMSALVRY